MANQQPQQPPPQGYFQPPPQGYYQPPPPGYNQQPPPPEYYQALSPGYYQQPPPQGYYAQQPTIIIVVSYHYIMYFRNPDNLTIVKDYRDIYMCFLLSHCIYISFNQ